MKRMITAIFPFTDFLYILQLEEYSSRRFLKWLPRFFFRRNIQQRQHLDYTSRVKITLGVSVGIWVMGMVWLWAACPPLLIAIGSVVWMLSIPIIVLMVNAMLSQGFAYLHARIRARAALRLSEIRKTCRIVMIAGSFGKTTTKHFVEQLIRYQYRIQATPGTVNSPAGIASWIIHEVRNATKVLIIEADGYSKAEYQETCAMVSADIVLITNIGDQHLERFGSRASLADAMSETIVSAQEEGKIICTTDTRSELRPDAFGKRTVHIVDTHGPLMYKGVDLPNPRLSSSNRTNLQFALALADLLDVPTSFVADTVQKLTVPDRRQKERDMYGYAAIDDSFNMTWSTAQAGIAAAAYAAHSANKKLLVITAGIVELGPDDQDKNIRLGELLSREADHVIILNSMFAADIQKGMGDPKKYTVVASLSVFRTQTHVHFSPNEWLLLVQPEMNDLYY